MEPTEGKVETREFLAYGDELMNIGIVVDRIDFFKLGGDFAAFLYEICRPRVHARGGGPREG